VGLGEVVDGGNARVVERRHGLRFAMKARDAFGVAGVGLRQDFDRHLAIELGVEGKVHLAHSAGADLAEDFMYAEPGSLGERQDG
jgi:hypothetical protein